MKFFINHISDSAIPNNQKVLPILCMELVHDGKHDYHKFHEKIQNAEITFSMVNVETGLYKVANKPAFIQKLNDTCCGEEFEICYQFTKREINTPGVYKGIFTIKFLDDLKCDDYSYPEGVLTVPMKDGLDIVVK